MGRERGYQRHPRFTKRLEVKFSASGLSFTGISSNLSESGLFIRTNRGFMPGTIIDIELQLPDGKTSFLKGLVKRTIKTPLSSLKNGMGIEFTERDATYINFMRAFTGDSGEEEKPPEYQIISCPNCGVKNKVLNVKLSMGPKCGKCGTPLQ
jgi:Tfp pilus assembly protein PilZ